MNLLEDIAKLGHSIRIGDNTDIGNVKNIAQEIYNTADELSRKGAKITQLLKYTQNMLKAYEQWDTITLADTLEYELLDELEALLKSVKS